jgi:hypothetical protein
MLLAACASYSGSGLKPGEARLDDVQGLIGLPATSWRGPDGSVQLAYSRSQVGFHTFMVALGPDGRLQSIANVLECKYANPMGSLAELHWKSENFLFDPVNA